MLNGKVIVLGISACGHAWAAPELVKALQDQGADVEIILTNHAAHFVTELSLRNITRKPVLCDAYEPPKMWNSQHKPLAARADLMLVAPASADVVAKAAHGIADDLLSTTLLSVSCPVLFVPEISAAMCKSPAVRRNLAQLQEDNIHVLGASAFAERQFYPFPPVQAITEATVRLLSE